MNYTLADKSGDGYISPLRDFALASRRISAAIGVSQWYREYAIGSHRNPNVPFWRMLLSKKWIGTYVSGSRAYVCHG
jgi:hypothetical protein